MCLHRSKVAFNKANFNLLVAHSKKTEGYNKEAFDKIVRLNEIIKEKNAEYDAVVLKANKAVRTLKRKLTDAGSLAAALDASQAALAMTDLSKDVSTRVTVDFASDQEEEDPVEVVVDDDDGETEKMNHAKAKKNAKKKAKSDGAPKVKMGQKELDALCEGVEFDDFIPTQTSSGTHTHMFSFILLSGADNCPHTRHEDAATRGRLILSGEIAIINKKFIARCRLASLHRADRYITLLACTVRPEAI